MKEAQRIHERKLTVVVRTDDRSSPIKAPFQWLPLGYPVPVYYIERPCDQAKKIDAQFYPDDGTTVLILHREIVRVCEVTDQHLVFAGGSAVPATAAELEQYLRGELVPGKEISPDTVLTLYYIEYVEGVRPASE